MFRDDALTGTILRAAWRRATARCLSGLARLFERTFLPFAPLDVAVPALRAQTVPEAQPDHEPAPSTAPARLGPPLEWIS